MADPNTLNDVQYEDANVTRAKEREEPLPRNPGDEYDYVLSFFNRIMKDESAANTFTQSIYQVSSATNIPVLQILETMRDQNAMQVNETMAFYLNNIRSPSTLLGVQNIIKPNFYAGRNVIG